MAALRPSVSLKIVLAGADDSVVTVYAVRPPGPTTVALSIVVLKFVNLYVTVSVCALPAESDGSAPKTEGAALLLC